MDVYTSISLSELNGLMRVLIKSYALYVKAFSLNLKQNNEILFESYGVKIQHTYRHYSKRYSKTNNLNSEPFFHSIMPLSLSQ